MLAVVILLAAAGAMMALSLRADRRFRAIDRLPMQWWVTGEVTWSAPRRLALAFMPALAVVSLGFITIMALNVPTRPGQEGLVLPTAIGMGALLVAVQLLHFWLIARTLRRQIP